MSTQSISDDVLKEKYLKTGETNVTDIFRRVAKGLASVETESLRHKYELIFYKNFMAGAIGAGRIMSSAGTGLQATLINCFVQPVGDCIQGLDEQGLPGIYEALREAAETMRLGGGVGYDFSHIRPRGAFVRATASMASGPCSYINVFDHSCTTVESAGSRRGAQMGVLRIDHPDIFEFIEAKRTPGRWNNFNVSVSVSDLFMKTLNRNGEWQLIHRAEPGEPIKSDGAYQREDGMWVYQTLPAKKIWDRVTQSAYDFSEPGVLFIDHINSDNNLSYCESIESTNPCGEQPLPPYGCCNLGPIILPRFVSHPFDAHSCASFDFDAFEEAVRIQVRALDNVLDLSMWPLPQQRDEAMSKRRIGVGFTGLGDTLVMLGVRYDQPQGRAMAVRIATCMRDAAYLASISLAMEKGPFPKFDAQSYLAPGHFANRLPVHIQTQIRLHGIRNSHLLSIAPTGTVSLAFADNTSNGIEPAFSWVYRRKKRTSDGLTIEYAVEDHAYRLYRDAGGDVTDLPEYFISALQMSASAHIEMMQCIQPLIDTAISKTVNVPVDFPYEDFKDLYQKAWEGRLKGMATYRPNDILGSVLETMDGPKKEIVISEEKKIDPMRSVIERRPKGSLPSVAEKLDYWTSSGHQTLYLLVSFMPVEDVQQSTTIDRAIEFFMPVGQTGESQQWITSSMRLLSLAARGGFLSRALSDMRKVIWERGPVRLGTYQKSDGTHVPMWHDSEVAAIAYAIQMIIQNRNSIPDSIIQCSDVSHAHEPSSYVMSGKKCVECGAYALIKKDGCEFCTQCGFMGTCG